MEERISQLVAYALSKGWAQESDRIYLSNVILEAIGADGFDGLTPVTEPLPPLQEILDDLCRMAYENGVLEGDSVTYFDLFDTKLMGLLTPRPSEVIASFQKEYQRSPEAATDWYYTFSGDTNYFRRERVAKDKKWVVATEYGDMDITINLSKPEKDPKAIAAAGKLKSTSYPKCALCAENEGYAGRLNHPARQNHRIIPLRLDGTDFFLQYSPYGYYNEHCIVLNKEHVPMRINEKTFRNLLDFVTLFPHYFIGSNADLPIVGGSVLSHDHYQGGRYDFAMAKAPVEREVTVPGFETVKTGMVKWPMPCIRLCGADKEEVVALATHILNAWRTYDDPSAFIFHETDGEQHSTITPIARRNGADYELDLVLRNNITTEEYPLGVFHPHKEKHHIKKENIGLIEVMGLAVLPARLKEELSAVAEGLVTGADLSADETTASHATWAAEVKARHPELNAENALFIVEEETGHVFAEVLKDAGCFKRDEAGKAAFFNFVKTL